MIIRAITKTTKKVLDRYTIYFWDGSCLTLSSNPEGPQGISQWGEYFGINDSDFETGIVNGERMLNWFELSGILQAHVEKRVREGRGK